MSQRWNYAKHSRDALMKISEIAAALKHGSIDEKLINLVNIRASQLNGCAFCVDMHVKESRLLGERDLRVHHILIWRESPLFSEREKAALAWTEAVTKLGEEDPVPDAVYDYVRTQFSDQELSDLTFAVGLINFWNRIAISSRTTPGSQDKHFGLDKVVI